MKALKHTSILASALLMMTAVLNSCDAVWGADVSYGTPYYGWDGDWLPALAGNPLLSPFYYGGTAFPIGNPKPVPRPGNGPLATPNIRPSQPAIPPTNGAIGNIRPGQSGNGPSISRPSTGGSSLPYININGSNPGLQTPPAGSGLRVTPNGK